MLYFFWQDWLCEEVLSWQSLGCMQYGFPTTSFPCFENEGLYLKIKTISLCMLSLDTNWLELPGTHVFTCS